MHVAIRWELDQNVHARMDIHQNRMVAFVLRLFAHVLFSNRRKTRMGCRCTMRCCRCHAMVQSDNGHLVMVFAMEYRLPDYWSVARDTLFC